jgi:16S rRNA (guanine(1405)-N(7))-methyltransferase
LKVEGSDERREQLDRLIKAVLESQKYRNVCEDLIKNIGMRELSKHKNFKQAVKSTKNKLHQVGGAYFIKRPDYGNWLEELRIIQKTKREDLFGEKCTEIMSYHHSTKERLKVLDQFYSSIFSMLPPIHSIMDIACGFNPLSIPKMPVSDVVRYYAYDVYHDLTDFLNGFLKMIGVEGCAETRDVIQDPPAIHADLALILYSMPCLEQIDKSAGKKILESIDANFIVVSYPVRTLVGRVKDMRGFYQAQFNRLIDRKDWDTERLNFSTEMVFIIWK